MDVKTFINKHNFKNKTKALQHIKQLLNTLPKNKPLYNEILFDLLKLHYYFYNRNPEYFIIKKSPKFTYCFHFIKNNVIHDFSYIKCFDNIKQIEHKNKNLAYRCLIIPQIREFKDNHFFINVSCLCPTTGNVLYNNSYTHVDHNYDYMPFRNITKEFETLYNYPSASLITIGDADNRRFKHDIINTNFIVFHKTNASLRCIYYYDNLKHSR